MLRRNPSFHATNLLVKHKISSIYVSLISIAKCTITAISNNYWKEQNFLYELSKIEVMVCMEAFKVERKTQ
jgi:hypothetical protein